MGRNVWRFFSASLHKWVVAIIGVKTLLISCDSFGDEPSQIHMKQFIEKALWRPNHYTIGNLLEEFDRFDRFFALSKPLEGGHQFLASFIEEINRRYNRALTVLDACFLIKRDLPILQISEDAKQVILCAVEMFEETPAVGIQKFAQLDEKIIKQVSTQKIGWPWEWNWFGFNKRSNQNRINEKKPFLTPLAIEEIPVSNEEFPGSIYAGGAEIFAGALLLIISEVFPSAGKIGWGLIGDGSRRVWDGVVELSDERWKKKEDLSSNPLSIQF